MRVPLTLPAGLDGDDTTFSAEGRWASASNVRFRLGKPEVIGGWESLTTTLLNGVCRTVFPWTDNAAVINVAFGTHSSVEITQGSAESDITPFGPPTRLGTDPLTVSNGAALVTVAQPSHGQTTGTSVIISGAVEVGGITPSGTFTITVIDADTYSYTFTSNATSDDVGGGTTVVAVPQVVLPPGQVDGTGSDGYGTGAYGIGPWGITSPTIDYFPRTWSFDAWGEQLLMSPRNGGLFLWENDTTQKAVAIPNAPSNITFCMVAPMNGGYMAFALGCNEEVSGVFNPMCIRHCSVRDLTTWETLTDGSTAREYVLTGGGRIVAARMCGPYMLIWTNKDLFLGSYVGALNQPWSFTRQGRNCGLIGPNAVIVVGQTAFWAGADRQFYSYVLGGAPTAIECPIRTAYAQNLAASQSDKIVASSNSEYSEIRFDYPDARDGFENSRYLTLQVAGGDAGSWSQGMMPRTAFVDAQPTLYPIGVTADGHIYYHEKGQSADGSPFAWFIRTAGQVVDPNYVILTRELWPDFQNQMGAISVTLAGRFFPQDTPVEITAPPMAPGDQKADFLISGRIFEVTFAGNSSPTAARIGAPTFDVVRTSGI